MGVRSRRRRIPNCSEACWIGDVISAQGCAHLRSKVGTEPAANRPERSFGSATIRRRSQCRIRSARIEAAKPEIISFGGKRKIVFFHQLAGTNKRAPGNIPISRSDVLLTGKTEKVQRSFLVGMHGKVAHESLGAYIN